MNCKKCGTVLEVNQAVCPNCGEPVSTQQNQNGVNFINANESMNGMLNTNMTQQNNSQNNYSQNNNSNNNFGLFSIILAIVGIVICFKWAFVGLAICIVGLVFANKYKKETNQKTAGKALNIIGLVISVLLLLVQVIIIGGLVALGFLFGDSTEDTNADNTP